MEALMNIGIIMMVVGGIWTLIVAFKESIVWGLACFFIPPVTFVFLFLHWPEAKRPFFLQLAGLVIGFVAAYAVN